MGSAEQSEIDLRLRVVSSNWGDSSSHSIEVLLTDVASHLTLLFREPPTGIIVVAPTPTTEGDPITPYRPSPQVPFTILLSARDDYWCQFAYQFSHELCHVLSDYERLRENPNNWFHEAICELASVFALRRMAERWLTCPPYPGRTDYADSLDSYADSYLSRAERRLPVGTTLSDWLLSEEDSLRQDRHQRDKNAVVAYTLLPIFESEPAGWNAIRRLPKSSAMFEGYLREWHSLVEPLDRPFVKRMLGLFKD